MLKKYLIAGIASLLISSQVIAGSWQFTQPGDTLMWNGFNNKWSYEAPGSTLQWNGFNNNWSYQPPGSTLRWNGFN